MNGGRNQPTGPHRRNAEQDTAIQHVARQMDAVGADTAASRIVGETYDEVASVPDLVMGLAETHGAARVPDSAGSWRLSCS